MQPDEVPTPAAIAARPRDPRGFPVLAITPWRDGSPEFAVTSPSRILVCAVERRCSICGLGLARGPVWRVVAADEAVAIAEAPTGFENSAATVEPPGHRLCMLYAAVVCPWLARPNARRRLDAPIAGEDNMRRGEARGAVGEIGGAVVAFETYEFSVSARVEFRYRAPVELHPHLLGEEHLPQLREGTTREAPPAESCPPWLLADEASAQERAERYL